jgi:hypothetical protein
MSPFARNLIMSASLAAVILGLLKGLVALPETLHRAGIVAPVTWIEARQ